MIYKKIYYFKVAIFEYMAKSKNKTVNLFNFNVVNYF